MSDSAYRHLFELIKPYWKRFSVAMLALGLGSACNLLLPEIIRRLVENDIRTIVLNHLWLVVSALGLILAFQGICFYARSLLFGQIGQFVVAELRQRLVRSLIWREISFYDQARASDLVSRLNSDVQMVQDAVSIKLSVFLRYSLQVFVGLILMLVISVKLTIAILFGLPIIIGFSLILGKKLRKVSRAQQAELGSYSATAEEVFALIRMVKAHSSENFEIQRLGQSNSKVMALGIERAGLSSFFGSFVNFLMSLFLVILFAYGFLSVAQGQLSNGDLTAFVLYGALVAVSFAFVAGGYSEFVQALGASDRVFELLDRSKAQPNPKSAIGAQKSLEAGPLSVKFQQVTFRYENRPSHEVLRDLSFSIPAGNLCAIVGPSGAGKSTIINLILGFYKNYQGIIELGGMDLQQLDLAELRSKMAYVSQEPMLFNISIKENLCYGLENPQHCDRIEEVCSQLNILDFINTLPKKFDAKVGDRGLQLSGGQRQRLMIARALLRQPKLLILDEATSALDTENESLVRQALRDLVPDATRLVIAHRLSTIKSAGQILVINKGMLIEQGDHSSLLGKDGLYKRLVDSQEFVD